MPDTSGSGTGNDPIEHMYRMQQILRAPLDVERNPEYDRYYHMEPHQTQDPRDCKDKMSTDYRHACRGVDRYWRRKRKRAEAAKARAQSVPVLNVKTKKDEIAEKEGAGVKKLFSMERDHDASLYQDSFLNNVKSFQKAINRSAKYREKAALSTTDVTRLGEMAVQQAIIMRK